MGRKKVILITTLFLAMAALYLYEYKDAILGRPIQISHTFRLRMSMSRRQAANLGASVPLIPTFNLGADYRLTSIQLIRLDELKTKGFAHPLWDLVADTKSYPVHVFFYGRGIPGMHPKKDYMDPEPLETNVTYRLTVKAGRLKGVHDFTITSQDVMVPGAN